ncbi:MAG: hypothetical protein M4579_000271 [Chaenotheca gracillima]|nr:MAG: hypothetical protein M4579_000271 [Chaenotheca gracillima]
MTSIDERRRPIVVPSEAQQGFTVPTQKVRGSNSEHTERRDWNNDHQSSHEITFQSKRVSVPERPQKQSMRPILPHNSLSETQDLLKLIPGSLSPVVTSQLLTELAKPISSMDEEGYIYMFWLSDAEHTPTPSSTAASSLLVTPRSSDVKKQQAQATSLLRETAVDGNITGKETQTRKQVLVKIGRASNVQRRMNEWQRQCGFNLSLIRYYPYVPSSSSARQTPSPSPSPLPSPGTSPGPSTPTKVPHVYRVERLIHLELAESRMKKNCLACGKEHREWFSIDASRDGIRAVDGVVRRWVAWAEHQNSISLR